MSVLVIFALAVLVYPLNWLLQRCLEPRSTSQKQASREQWRRWRKVQKKYRRPRGHPRSWCRSIYRDIKRDEVR